MLETRFDSLQYANEHSTCTSNSRWFWSMAVLYKNISQLDLFSVFSKWRSLGELVPWPKLYFYKKERLEDVVPK